MAIAVSLSGIGKDGAHSITLNLGGATAAPQAEDSSVTQTARGVEVTLKGAGKAPDKDKDKTEASGESGGTSSSGLDRLQKAIEMAKKQLEQAQRQLSAVEGQNPGESKEAQAAHQAERAAAQASVAAASAALMTAYAAYTEALKKAGGGGSGGVSTRA